MAVSTPKIAAEPPTYYPSLDLDRKITAYISEFDGVKKDFSPGLEQKFNNLYHEEYCNKSNGNTNNRDKLRKLNEELFNLGARVSIERFDFVQANCFLFTCHVICEGRSLVINNLVAVKDNKIIRAQAVGDRENMEIYHRKIL